MTRIDPDSPISATRKWIETVVIGLQLCPFAAVPFRKDRIRYVVSEAFTAAELLDDLGQELAYVFQADPEEVETSVLIHPACLHDFEDYWDFLAVAEALIREQKLEGEIQVAGFHPEFRFAGTDDDDAANYTNRSPFPMIHLLREDSITQALDHYSNPDAIPERNIELLREMGLKKIQELRARCTE